MYLEKINSPADVKKLTVDEVTALAEEMRKALLFRLSKHGGHFGPNFGMVEATIAMHYVFESPKDKIVFDVSHKAIHIKCSQAERSPTLTLTSSMISQATQTRRRASMTFLRLAILPLL